MTELAPTMFSKLVYVTFSAPPPGTNVLEMMGNCVQGEREDKVGYPVDLGTTTLEQQFAVMFCNDMSAPDREAFLAKLGHDSWPMSSYIYRDWRHEHLGAVRSTYVQCEQDMSLPPAWQERFAQTLRVDRVVRIDAGHQAMTTRPQELAAALLAETQA